MSWIPDTTLNWVQYACSKVIKSRGVPNHVAFIMDGNIRYAKKESVATVEGNTKGFDKLTEIFQWCLGLGILEGTVYAFITENFKRSKQEVDDLMEYISERFQRFLDEREKLKEIGVCVRIIGNLSLIPSDLRKLFAEAMIVTKTNNKAFLNIAFAYTSQEEITSAIISVVTGVEKSAISYEDVNSDLISQCLYTSTSPDSDLLIRTSGETRFSDFLLWQTTRTYIYFSSDVWPEFGFWHMLAAVFYYQLNRMNTTENCRMNNDCVNLFLRELDTSRQMYLERASQGAAL